MCGLGTSGKNLPESLNPSPRKPLHRSKVMISYADTLYESKSPVKNIAETKTKTLEELQEEDEEALKDLRPKVYRKKNLETNFLTLNMKKGYHAKGKLTAEQKRKFKRKANYNKFKAGQ
ncbi:hypothetical protein PENTCL1PPCAC_22724 [Pristionchus entomophagus]|uniref:Uncharacterized protein n=1 Tax=Pristionchus entomophagus TaxID=358040 RepID=A0AAV5U2A1_9BILA|nr:hypothetical protein PENTCL1PPCAC_22724 [Pristionchus entomophagus]